ncbi:MAG: hypothetical protein WDO73_16590 [Ignavibacteriota bacterium]
MPTIEVNAASGRPLGTIGEEEYTVGYFQPIATSGKRSKRVAVAEKGLELAEGELGGNTAGNSSMTSKPATSMSPRTK